MPGLRKVSLKSSVTDGREEQLHTAERLTTPPPPDLAV